MRWNISKKVILIVIVVLMVALTGFALAKKREITIKNSTGTAKIATPTPLSKGPLAGVDCANSNARPWAVMMPSDPEARPLAGIGQADMAFEMPVTESGVTRMMMVFQCNHPKELGSIRSAREDFVPLVFGLDAIYIHWGGEHGVLAELDSHILDNIDCIKLDGTTCLRKRNIPMPHNGYTTSDLIVNKAKALGYKLSDNSVSYPHTGDWRPATGAPVNPPALFNDANRVTWTYHADTNTYTRARAGAPEIDRATGTQVAASNIAVLHTTSQYVSMLYNRVKTIGSGTMTMYQNGIVIPGTWQKETKKSKLKLLDTSGKEIPLVPGSTWFEIVTE